ncbi:hypothetical protein CHUAL_011160 [Chamberlinius hualienensis]
MTSNSSRIRLNKLPPTYSHVERFETEFKKYFTNLYQSPPNSFAVTKVNQSRRLISSLTETSLVELCKPDSNTGKFLCVKTITEGYLKSFWTTLVIDKKDNIFILSIVFYPKKERFPIGTLLYIKEPLLRQLPKEIGSSLFIVVHSPTDIVAVTRDHPLEHLICYNWKPNEGHLQLTAEEWVQRGNYYLSRQIYFCAREAFSMVMQLYQLKGQIKNDCFLKLITVYYHLKRYEEVIKLTESYVEYSSSLRDILLRVINEYDIFLILGKARYKLRNYDSALKDFQFYLNCTSQGTYEVKLANDRISESKHVIETVKRLKFEMNRFRFKKLDCGDYFQRVKVVDGKLVTSMDIEKDSIVMITKAVVATINLTKKNPKLLNDDEAFHEAAHNTLVSKIVDLIFRNPNTYMEFFYNLPTGGQPKITQMYCDPSNNKEFICDVDTIREVCLYNAMDISVERYISKSAGHRVKLLGKGIFRFSGHVKHNCEPNTRSQYFNDVLVAYANRDLKMGEEINLSYVYTCYSPEYKMKVLKSRVLTSNSTVRAARSTIRKFSDHVKTARMASNSSRILLNRLPPSVFYLKQYDIEMKKYCTNRNQSPPNSFAVTKDNQSTRLISSLTETSITELCKSDSNTGKLLCVKTIKEGYLNSFWTTLVKDKEDNIFFLSIVYYPKKERFLIGTIMYIKEPRLQQSTKETGYLFVEVYSPTDIVAVTRDHPLEHLVSYNWKSNEGHLQLTGEEWKQRGTYYLSRRMYFWAREALSMAMQHYQSNRQSNNVCFLNLITVYYHLKRYEEVIKLTESYVEYSSSLGEINLRVNIDEYDILLILGKARYKLRNYNFALMHFKDYLKYTSKGTYDVSLANDRVRESTYGIESNDRLKFQMDRYPYKKIECGDYFQRVMVVDGKLVTSMDIEKDSIVMITKAVVTTINFAQKNPKLFNDDETYQELDHNTLVSKIVDLIFRNPKTYMEFFYNLPTGGQPKIIQMYCDPSNNQELICDVDTIREVCLYNAMDIYVERYISKSAGYTVELLGKGIFRFPAHVKHNCEPNTRSQYFNDVLVAYANRDLKMGEEINLSYIYNCYSPENEMKELQSRDIL